MNTTGSHRPWSCIMHWLDLIIVPKSLPILEPEDLSGTTSSIVAQPK